MKYLDSQSDRSSESWRIRALDVAQRANKDAHVAWHFYDSTEFYLDPPNMHPLARLIRDPAPFEAVAMALNAAGFDAEAVCIYHSQFWICVSQRANGVDVDHAESERGDRLELNWIAKYVGRGRYMSERRGLSIDKLGAGECIEDSD